MLWKEALLDHSKHSCNYSLLNNSLPEGYQSTHDTMPTKSWIIGFTEAEGSFYITAKDSLCLDPEGVRPRPAGAVTPVRMVHGFGYTQKLDQHLLVKLGKLFGHCKHGGAMSRLTFTSQGSFARKTDGKSKGFGESSSSPGETPSKAFTPPVLGVTLAASKMPRKGSGSFQTEVRANTANHAFSLDTTNNRVINHAFSLDTTNNRVINHAFSLDTTNNRVINHAFSLDTTNNRVINNAIEYFRNTLIGMKSVEFRIWERSYFKHKGDFIKLAAIQEQMRNLRKN
jgi:hypothetical protein